MAARIDFIFVLSDRAKADYPQDATKMRFRRQKALSLNPQLALQDIPADESWGHWQANASAAAGPSGPSEPPRPSNIKQEEPENLMADSSAFH